MRSQYWRKQYMHTWHDFFFFSNEDTLLIILSCLLKKVDSFIILIYLAFLILRFLLRFYAYVKKHEVLWYLDPNLICFSGSLITWEIKEPLNCIRVTTVCQIHERIFFTRVYILKSEIGIIFPFISPRPVSYYRYFQNVCFHVTKNWFKCKNNFFFWNGFCDMLALYF